MMPTAPVEPAGVVLSLGQQAAMGAQAAGVAVALATAADKRVESPVEAGPVARPRKELG